MSERRWNSGEDAPVEQQAPQPGMAIPPAKEISSIDDLCLTTAVASRGGVAVAKVKEIFETIATEYKAKVAESAPVKVCLADESPLRAPVVILYVIKGNNIFTYPMIIEACGEKLDARSHPNNRNILIDMPTCRYYPGTMERLCIERVKNDAVASGLVRGNIIIKPVNYIVLKRNVNLEDKRELAAYFDSAIAAFSVYEKVMNKVPTSNLKYSKIKNNSFSMISKHQITPGATSRDIFGNVIAQDFKVDLLLREADQSSTDLHRSGREIAISSVTGYVDFAYHQPSAVQMQQAQQQFALKSAYNPVIIPAYDPYIVITSASTLGNQAILGDNILTAAMALASLNGIAQNQRWSTIFGRNGSDSNRKTSIGALGLEHDPAYIEPVSPQVLPVAAGFEGNNPNLMSPLEVISKFCYNTMLIAIDVEDGSPMKWLLDIFGNATRGSIQESVILNELNYFSDNKFSQIWNGSQSIVAYDPTMVHLGYHKDAAGNVNDIRTLDYLTVLNYCKGDRDIMRSYTQAFLPGQTTAEVQHYKREVIKMAYPNAEITGMAKRYFINTAFISALDQLFAQCDLKIILEGISDIGSNVVRGTAFDGTFNAPLTSHNVFVHNTGLPTGTTQLQFGNTSWF